MNRSKSRLLVWIVVVLCLSILRDMLYDAQKNMDCDPVMEERFSEIDRDLRACTQTAESRGVYVPKLYTSNES